MDDEIDIRIRRAMRDEVSQLPVVVSEEMITRRADREGARGRIATAVVALAASGVAATAIAVAMMFGLSGTPGGLGSGLLGGPASPSQSAFPDPTPRMLLLPVGVYETGLPIDGICFAISVEVTGQTNMPLQWWKPGSEDNCSTRMDPLSVAEARLAEFPLMRLDIPESETADQWTFRVTGVPPGEIRIARQGEHEVVLTRVDVVDPSLVPTP